ncbi:MAG TPA: alpha/beta hydrolase [Steroidobacteraceae bacterium]|jgi:pimeloyl-ACP methyl ester carboxylesterase
MQRRQFMEAALGTLAAGALTACASNVGTMTSGEPSKSTDVEDWVAARRYVETRFGRVAYVERGTGQAALFLHGFPLNSFQWRGAFDRLSKYRRCVAPDWMGLGYTQVAAGQGVTPDAQVAMLATLLDTLSIPTVDIVANDSGGAIAQLFLIRYTTRVRTLLLTNCDTEPDSPPPALQPVLDMSRAGTFADTWIGPWAADKNLARSKTGLGGLTYTYPERLSDETIDYYLSPLVSSPQRKTLLHAYALGLDPNPLAGIEPALRKSSVPTRILWGTGDDIFSAASPGYLDRTFGNSRGVREVPGAKLFWPEEFPDLLAEEARNLWGVSG